MLNCKNFNYKKYFLALTFNNTNYVNTSVKLETYSYRSQYHSTDVPGLFPAALMRHEIQML